MLKTIFPYFGAHVFAFLLEHMHQERHLPQVEGVVAQRELRVFPDSVDLLFRMGGFLPELVCLA